ncbi:hypothetical protein ACTWPB_11595 [Nocardia sp. IBHARD005]|uniref:hypothetical protein n=1 Tax=Nocardia sp. IBHARD005 TaxID=3457765 RepID=UPI004057E6D0
MTWTLTPDEFAGLWHRETGLDAFDHPAPLVIRESCATRDEQDHLVNAALSTRFPGGSDQGLSAAFTILANADTRLRCAGQLDGGLEVRAHGAALDNLGVVVHQYATTSEPSTPIVMTLTRRTEVPSRLCATLPPTPAGSAGPMLGYTPRVRGEEPPTRWGVEANGERPVEERIRSLVRQRRSGEGQFVIQRGMNTDRPHPPRYSSWIDVAAGPARGRYLITVDDNETRVVPVSGSALARELIAQGR